MNIKRPIIIFDLETTGVEINKDRIVQIGAIKMNVDGSLEEKSVLINPTIPIPKEATEIHKITDEDIKDAPTFKQIAKNFCKWLTGCDIGGYNSDNFDVPLLIEEFARAGVQYPVGDINFIDVIKIERLVNSHKLEDTYKRYTGNELKDAHDALEDSKATLIVLQKQIELYNEIIPNKIDELDQFCQGDKKRVDYAGKLYEKDGEIYWNFGKHKDQLVKETLEYASWVIGVDFPSNTKDHLKRIMNSQNEH